MCTKHKKTTSARRQKEEQEKKINQPHPTLHEKVFGRQQFIELQKKTNTSDASDKNNSNNNNRNNN